MVIDTDKNRCYYASPPRFPASVLCIVYPIPSRARQAPREPIRLRGRDGRVRIPSEEAGRRPADENRLR